MRCRIKRQRPGAAAHSRACVRWWSGRPA